jgi:hypothetical protein
VILLFAAVGELVADERDEEAELRNLNGDWLDEQRRLRAAWICFEGEQ